MVQDVLECEWRWILLGRDRSWSELTLMIVNYSMMVETKELMVLRYFLA